MRDDSTYCIPMAPVAPTLPSLSMNMVRSTTIGIELVNEGGDRAGEQDLVNVEG